MNNTNSYMKITCKIILTFLLIILCTKNFAENLGVVGETYPIAEEDFLSFIKNRISTMQTNGEWKTIENQFKSNVQKHAIRPTPISSIIHALETKSWFYNPSITVPYDLRDATGRVIAKAGTTINPLSMVTLHKVLIFIDGYDVKQQAWAKQIDKTYHGKTKLILVNGSIVDNERYFSKPIYFDQEARLVNKFNIKHVPALVYQDKLLLKITEVAL